MSSVRDGGERWRWRACARRRPPAEGFGARRAQKNTGAEVLARPRMLADALGRDTGGLAGAADAGAAAAELCETGVEEVEKNMASGCKCRRVRGVAMIWAMRQWGGSTVCGGGGGEGGEALWPGAHWVVGLRDLESCRRRSARGRLYSRAPAPAHRTAIIVLCWGPDTIARIWAWHHH